MRKSIKSESPKNWDVFDLYSIRQSLQGALHDFVRASGFDCVHLEELVNEIVGLLAVYREEDALLFPEVFVFPLRNGLTALSPGGSHIEIGTAQLAGASAATILKNCAPLAYRGWAIFVVKETEAFRYGLFRSVRHSLATGAEESMRDLGIEAPVIHIRNRGHLVVELQNTLDQHFTVALTTNQAQASPLATHVSGFVERVCAGVQNPESFRDYLRRLLISTLQDSHGTLLAVLRDVQAGLQDPTLARGVWPKPGLLLSELYERARSTGTADALADLQGAETLLAGMIDSDGVVVFGNDGSVLGYHVFLQPNDEEKLNIPEVGGGRRRTFSLMKLRLNTVFSAVFFRSQDGETLCASEN